MNRRHLRLADAELFVNHFRQRRKAVRRAGSVRDDVVRRRVVLLFVDAEDNRDVFVLCGSRDNDFFDRPAQVLSGIFGVRETPRRFDDYFRPCRL